MSDHPITDPGDGRVQCETCGKYVWLVIHSCKGVWVGAPRCTCTYHSEDRGGGYTEIVPEYEPTCPVHSVHRWDEATGMYVLKEPTDG